MCGEKIVKHWKTGKLNAREMKRLAAMGQKRTFPAGDMLTYRTAPKQANMRLIIFVTAIVVLSNSAMSQQPYAGLQTRPIKTLSEQQIADLNAGRGMGLALAAELNGYPGPIHLIELAEQLHLSPDQKSKLKSLFEAMKTETIPLGTALISQERSLNDDFANHTVTLASLEGATQKIGVTQAALRAAHLKYHLSTVAVLTPEQIAQYNRLRGYTGNEDRPHSHHEHQ